LFLASDEAEIGIALIKEADLIELKYRGKP
jgi:hypothetical protein